MRLIQPLDRTAPLLLMRPGRIENRTDDCERLGTTSLFAALDAETGKIIVQTHHRHRSTEFRTFLETIEKNVPAGTGRASDPGRLRYTQARVDSQPACLTPRFQFHFTQTSAS